MDARTPAASTSNPRKRTGEDLEENERQKMPRIDTENSFPALSPAVTKRFGNGVGKDHIALIRLLLSAYPDIVEGKEHTVPVHNPEVSVSSESTNPDTSDPQTSRLSKASDKSDRSVPSENLGTGELGGDIALPTHSQSVLPTAKVDTSVQNQFSPGSSSSISALPPTEFVNDILAPVATTISLDSFGVAFEVSSLPGFYPQDTKSSISPIAVIRDQPRSRSLETYPSPRDVTDLIILEKKVALGGHSDVWRGTLRTDTGALVQVAIKELRVRQHQSCMPHDERLRKRFTREVLLWGRLQHPNIVPLIGFSVASDSLPRLVSPWYSNGNVVEYLRLNPDANRPKLLHDVAQGLHYLHLSSLVHGDIKGDNVLVNSDGVASLCDFGLAKFIDEALHITGFTTTTQGVGGTVRFLCPELLEDQPKTRTTDIWAFGCLTIQVMTNKVPYAHVSTASAVQMAIVRGEPPLPVDYETSEDTAFFWKAIRRCWFVDARQRPSISELLGYIRATIMRSKPISDSGGSGVSVVERNQLAQCTTTNRRLLIVPTVEGRVGITSNQSRGESGRRLASRHYPCHLRRRCRPVENLAGRTRSDCVSSPF